MDLPSEKYPHVSRYPKRSGKGVTIIITMLSFLACLILWSSVFNDFRFNGDITWIYIKAFIGSFCLLLGFACISSVRRN
jgi:hypothetical protein